MKYKPEIDMCMEFNFIHLSPKTLQRIGIGVESLDDHVKHKPPTGLQQQFLSEAALMF